MPYCSVPGCHSLRGREKVSFHQIPSDLKRRNQWLKAIGRKDPKGSEWIPNQYDSVCARHFTPDDFKGEGKIILLKKTAIPSVFEDSPISKATINSKAHKNIHGKQPNQKQEIKKRKRQKYEVMSTHATNILRMWLFHHKENPYPTIEEKFQLSLETKLTLIQINRWFTYARKKILESMFDSGSTVINYSKKWKRRLSYQNSQSSILPDLQNPGPENNCDGEYKAPLVVMLKHAYEDD